VNYMPDRCCGHPQCGAARDRNRRRRGNAPIPGNGRVLWDARCHFVRFAVHTYLLHGCSVALRETCARRLTHHRLSGRDVDARKDARRTLSFESVIYAGCQRVLHGCGIEPRCLQSCRKILGNLHATTMPMDDGLARLITLENVRDGCRESSSAGSPGGKNVAEVVGLAWNG
jgi:hypothetical protein